MIVLLPLFLKRLMAKTAARNDTHSVLTRQGKGPSFPLAERWALVRFALEVGPRPQWKVPRRVC
jgi:hypothetical protein